MTKINIDDMLKDHADAFKKGAEAIKHSTLGEHAAAVIEAHGEISIALLKASIEESIRQSASAKEGGNPSLDLQRVSSEAALAYLDSLLAKHRGN